MLSASEIKGRINGIGDTKKITDAMYMISSAKMRRATAELTKTAPYFEALAQKIGELFHYIPKTDNRYFKVTVPDNQLSLAIGNKGQNARLAAKLVGWKIDIRPESGFYGEE